MEMSIVNLWNLIENMATRPSLGGKQRVRLRDHPYATAAAVGAAAIALSALVNHGLARRAERRDPPRGQFLDVAGVRLHYVERGEGEPLVLLHGNGSMIQDFESSGLIARAAEKYRVIALDRPGYGHSARPRRTIWSPEAQADLIHEALEQLGATPAIVLGHSWGTLVATALGSAHPESVKALVLVSGYYYPTARVDVVAASGPALPHREPADVAAPDAQDLRAGAGAAEVRARLPGGARAASVPASRRRGGIRADDPRRIRDA
jgi:pimeloyl-ACP methyl ester carboxylesterase